ncbi:MAG: hypothetical protein K5756_07420 [Clostridiales bacterium]|nr:hypothetical protein [Clostridiales bacterium]
MDYEKLVELITKEVIKAMHLDNSPCAGAADDMSKPLALVIGDKEKLPLFALDTYRFACVDDYAKDGDIDAYECVYITALSNTELADIAMGRDAKPAQCAVIKALLSGKRVCLMESALPHRKYSATAQRTIYQMFEGYVCKLQSFGVELIREQKYGKNLNKSAIADNSVDKVITEALAKQLIKKDGDTIVLRRGTVITPSAKDIFNHSEKKVEFVD